ncbi:hypothetical protein [Rudaea cellulosilytica]|uniref:hypothetical protein n=1 Tax=Rudaea cellulosilytica TaxID=540746 RepID=UPI0012F7E386|nr:hypothetical protein [Rudaea cellulosilytica]
MLADYDGIEGMTVNERLSHFNLFAAFDEAVKSGKLEVIVSVLRRAQFTEAQANLTASSVLANPSRLGR